MTQIIAAIVSCLSNILLAFNVTLHSLAPLPVFFCHGQAALRYNMLMATHFIDILSPHYQDLLQRCEKRKISVNLDIQNLAVAIRDENIAPLERFLATEIRRALKNCAAGDKITLSESDDTTTIRISVKNSGAETLLPDEKARLVATGFEVRARFGYDTIITLKLAK